MTLTLEPTPSIQIPDLLQKNWQALSSLSQLSPSQREVLFSKQTNPFITYEFLNGLENYQCVGGETGWSPCYFLYENEEQLGLFICYLKSHSYGEYVFDWSWAEAYHRHGIHYYPKLLSAIPFTPVPTQKWLTNSSINEVQAWQTVSEIAEFSGITGAHLLFTETSLDKQPGQIERHGCQFHWFNKSPETQQAYRDFDDYLATMTARKRKMIKKERLKVINAGFKCEWRRGHEVTEAERSLFYQFYHNTYYKRGQEGYLTRPFFDHVFDSLSDNVRLLVCLLDNKMVAGALYFIDQSHLYGRYWGREFVANTNSNDSESVEFDALHFEACYYQGIELAIKLGLTAFNPGTQGEHKIPRGFQPVTTQSYHQLFLDPFHQAVEDFCLRERQHNAMYIEECETRLPFKKSEKSV